MSGKQPIPTNITLHRTSRTLSLEFDDGAAFDLPCEFLRVFTPSAEARGHGPGQEVLQTGKREVTIERIEPVGHYAVRLVFSDGHDTGLYTWEMLHDFGVHHDELWAAYLEKIEANGASRDPAAQPKTTSTDEQLRGGASKGGCGGGCSK